MLQNFEEQMKNYLAQQGIKYEDYLDSLMRNENSNENFKRKTREEYISMHNNMIQQRKNFLRQDKNQATIDLPIDINDCHPLGKNINEDYQEIKINELILGKENKKKYLILKIITKICIFKSLNFIGEDSDKNVIHVSIYDCKKYFGFEEDEDYLEKYIFTEGKYVIFIDPLYKIFKSGSDGLRCESPNEIGRAHV